MLIKSLMTINFYYIWSICRRFLIKMKV